MRTKWMVLGATLLAGCDGPDARLASFAERAAANQQRQNELIARQSEQVVQESRELAVAAKEVVALDARARQEMIAAHSSLQENLHVERAGVDEQRNRLEAERREIAAQRSRDPIVAAALQSLGAWLACAAPLALAGYALLLMHRGEDLGGDSLDELLIEELAGPHSLLLPATHRPLLGSADERSNFRPVSQPPAGEQPGSPADDESDEPPPF